ncbi:hypothetical protein [Desulfococcus sp.]|uniref:hypothetical protein n=1 Tax=Desulfococcus sp. TaxID=2025834 RepID=UPI00359321FD
MPRAYANRFFCAKCGYTGALSRENRCPNCGKIPGWWRFSGKGAAMPAAGMLVLAAGLIYFHLFHPRAAAELSRLFQPHPKHFHVGLDVSASINQDALEKIKDHLGICLRGFVGDTSISYQISTFGNPGCGKESIAALVATASPRHHAAFDGSVGKTLAAVAATPVAPREVTPLTTPFYGFLESALSSASGKRVIIFSDLMNDDGDCRERYAFPAEAIERFGADGSSDLVFLYTAPRAGGDVQLKRALQDQQQAFIDRMNALAEAGKVRVVFRRIPDDPLESLPFIRSELRKSLPSTLRDGIRDRLSRIFDAVFAASAS